MPLVMAPLAAPEVSVPAHFGDLFPPPLGDESGTSATAAARPKSGDNKPAEAAPPSWGGEVPWSGLLAAGESAVVVKSLPGPKSPPVAAEPAVAASALPAVLPPTRQLSPANARHALATSGMVVVVGLLISGVGALRRRASNRYWPA